LVDRATHLGAVGHRKVAAVAKTDQLFLDFESHNVVGELVNRTEEGDVQSVPLLSIRLLDWVSGGLGPRQQVEESTITEPRSKV
jgi:hypothetical protein